MGFVKKKFGFSEYFTANKKRNILSYTHRKGNAVLLISFVPLEKTFVIILIHYYCLRAKNNAQPKENTLC